MIATLHGWVPAFPTDGQGWLQTVADRVANWPPALSATLGGVVGAVVGSMLATLLVRWPQGRSALLGQSACDGCGRVLRVGELVPLVSFLWVRGRCRSCGSAIDPTHPLVEGLCAVAGATLGYGGYLLLTPLVWLLIVLALFDARHLWLPDPLVLAVAIAAMIAPPWRFGLGWDGRAVGGICGYAMLELLRLGYRWLRGREGLGGGDAKLFGAMGLWLGPLGLAPAMLMACGIGLVDAAIRLRGRADRRSVSLPLGTYLAVAGIGFVAAKAAGLGG